MKRFIIAIIAGLFMTGAAFFLQLNARSMASTPGQVTLANGKTVAWPPQVGKPYPDLELVDSRGNMVKLSDFKGKVIVIEPIGMTCPACNAFAGGRKKGGVKGMGVQGNTDSFADYFPQYAGVSLHDERIVFVNLLLYNLQMQGPSQADAKLWAQHFGLDRHKNTYVLAGGPELVNNASYNLVPGLQLVDKNFILRSDSSGHHPRDNMWQTLMPMVPALLKEKAK